MNDELIVHSSLLFFTERYREAALVQGTRSFPGVDPAEPSQRGCQRLAGRS